MKALTDKVIGIASDRQSEAIATLIRKHGGTPSVYSIQGTRIYNKSICIENIKTLIQEPFNWVILTTGIGAKTLEQTAADMGESDRFLNTLRNRKLAIRGSKTMNWLKEHALVPDRVSPDGTMAHLFTIFQTDNQQRSSGRVYLQVYDEDEALLKQELESLGYSVYLSKPYHYEEPKTETLHSLTKHIINEKLDAVVFTSKTQVRNLFGQANQKADLVKAFNEHVLAVAVGKVTAKEIADQGIHHLIQPKSQKMGAMIVTMNQYYETIVN
ncbi:uroporphyrinogen-III synthase [Sporolactobacillus sp. THM7-7]|nr:uroporphyrinogen-III synthase [Sporolactobacillus sp. THM7-7]